MALNASEFLQPLSILKDQLKVQSAQVVAALGCGGSGFFALDAARLVGDKGQVYAVDIVKGALSSVDSKAKLQGLYNVKTVWSDLEVFDAAEIPEASLDMGLLVNILFQSKKQVDIIREASRLIKPGGKLLVIDWKAERTPLGPPPDHRVDVDMLRAEIPALGFQEEKFFEAGKHHFGLVFTKL